MPSSSSLYAVSGSQLIKLIKSVTSLVLKKRKSLRKAPTKNTKSRLFFLPPHTLFKENKPFVVGNEWTDYVQQLVDFAHAFPRFSVMNNKTRPCIPEFLPNIFRVLEGLAGYPTVMTQHKGLYLTISFNISSNKSILCFVVSTLLE